MKRPAKAVLHPGAIRPRHKPKQSQAHPGVSPLHPVSHRNVGYQPRPRPLGLPPYHYDLAEHFATIGEDITKEKKMVFHVVGDTGGIQDGEFQNNVAAQMLDHLNSHKGGKPQFCYHVGDVVYYTGMRDDYYAQFYEPYSQYDVPIFSIPGNHDGEVDDPTAQVSLDGWVDYFMQAEPDVDPISKDAPRVQLNLPNVYWTLVTPLATIIGMYTNVPEGGSVDSKMADVLENAIWDTGRVPNLVLSGHVHNYQRIEQSIAPGGPTPFIVTGNGGYHNLHAVHSNPGDEAEDTKAVLKYVAAKSWGFVTLTIDKKTISGTTTEVDRTGRATTGDSFSYSAEPIVLADPRSVPTL